MQNNRFLLRSALALRILGICIMTMDIAMTGNSFSTIYFYFPYLFVMLECMLFIGHFFFHKSSLVYAQNGIIYYFILALAYTDWQSVFSIALAIIYTILCIAYIVVEKRYTGSLKPKARKY